MFVSVTEERTMITYDGITLFGGTTKTYFLFMLIACHVCLYLRCLYFFSQIVCVLMVAQNTFQLLVGFKDLPFGAKVSQNLMAHTATHIIIH